MGDSNVKGVQWISIGAIIVGIIFIVTGAIISGIAYTEITPPNYDDNYDRYIGSSVPRLIGPFMLCFGAIIIIGSAGMMVFQAFKEYEPIPQGPMPPKNDYHEEEKDYSPKATP